MTLNQWVPGSSPGGCTENPVSSHESWIFFILGLLSLEAQNLTHFTVNHFWVLVRSTGYLLRINKVPNSNFSDHPQARIAVRSNADPYGFHRRIVKPPKIIMAGRATTAISACRAPQSKSFNRFFMFFCSPNSQMLA